MKEFLFSNDNVPFWTAISAIALIATLAVIAYYSNKAARDTVKNFTTALEASYYTELDAMYLELLKLALGKPHLTDPSTLSEADKRREYDIYAYMVWNFLETIADRCNDDKNLEATWYPVIDAENRLHRQWFDDPRNTHKFKPAFHRFITNNKFRL